MHAIGVCLGLIGVTIVVIAVNIEHIEVAPILVYVIGLVTMLGLSAAYNMWPVSPARGHLFTRKPNFFICAPSGPPRGCPPQRFFSRGGTRGLRKSARSSIKPRETVFQQRAGRSTRGSN